jgi:oxygen-dependent protoporphyrinogen oxidase
VAPVAGGHAIESSSKELHAMEKHDVIVVGGGITGLTAAFEMVTKSVRKSIVLLEKSGRVGGIVGAHHDQGFTVDLGPHGFVDNGADVRYLVDRLGLADELVPATAEAQKIFLLKGDRLYQVPSTMGLLLTTPLLSWRGKLRLFAEVLVPRRMAEESAIDFVARRFGREVAQEFAVPAVRGVIGGDAGNFGIEGEFPIIKRLERQYRSVLIGSVRWQRQRRRTDPLATRLPSFREFGQRLKTFRGLGMQRLVDELEKALADNVRLGCAVDRLDRAPGGTWRVRLTTGEWLAADRVVLALPVDPTVHLLRPHLPAEMATLAALPRPDIRVLALGYRRSDVGTVPPGIGFVATPDRETNVLGAIHASTIFPEQAPPDTIMIRALAGGPRDAPILGVSQERAIELMHRELSRVFGITGAPVFAFEHLWRGPIPVYPIGHRRWVERVFGAVAQLGGLQVAGNSFGGVGVNDCVRDARRAAGAVLGALGPARR